MRADVPDAVIVLAGGAGSRLGGADKARLVVGGRTLLQRALAAAAGRPTVVVGPECGAPAEVTMTREDPPGGGPAAGVAAGFAAVTGLLAEPGTGRVDEHLLIGLLAVDQPGVGPGTLRRLAAAARAAAEHGNPPGGAVLVHDGRRQYATGVFGAGALRWAVRQRPSWHGVALRSLVGAVVTAEVEAIGDEALDVDTPADLARWRAVQGG